ncbi:MAG: hypothetical protein ACT4OO_12630 [Nitrospiraceae bacterium]
MQRLPAFGEPVATRQDEESKSPSIVGWKHWVFGTILAVLVGTWLVWFSAYLQRLWAQEEIRAACQRLMPETSDRCYDTVIIQRGVARR